MEGEQTPLTVAVLEGETNQVHNFIKCHSDLNAPSYVYDAVRDIWRSETALITAARLGRLEIVKLLIQGGAHLDIADLNLGKSPLHWACHKNHTEVAQELIKAGSSVNLRDYVNETALVEVIACKNLTLFHDLLNNGLLLDVQLNYDRDTGLIFAICWRQVEIALDFIRAGADVGILNTDSMDALHVALDLPLPPDGLRRLCSALLAECCVVNAQHLRLAHQLETKYEDHADLPSLLQHAASNPMELAGLCRYIVRKVLRNHVSGTSILPLINKLPLPSKLLDFVKISV